MKRKPIASRSAKNTKPTAYNSTFAPRTTRLKPAGETKRKKDARYRAYLKSPQWRAKRRACLERAGHRCECGIRVWEGEGTVRVTYVRRCGARATTVHHLTYARFGHELPEDLTACCKSHHDELESRLRPWNRNRKWSA